MNKETANYFAIYFDILLDTNKKLIALCSVDRNNEFFGKEKYIFDIIHSISMLIPYGINIDKKHSEKDTFEEDTTPFIKNASLYKNDSLYTLKDEIDYLEKDLDEIFENNIKTLKVLKFLRNKSEHIPHYNSIHASISDGNYFNKNTKLLFKNEYESFWLDFEGIICILSELNILFDKIGKDIVDFAVANNLTEYPYFDKLKHFNFPSYNAIYDSNFNTTR